MRRGKMFLRVYEMCQNPKMQKESKDREEGRLVERAASEP